jgi:hypothetical protein
MQRILLVVAAFWAIGIPALPAQQVTNDANPLVHPVTIRMGGIIVPAIADEPFSATAVIDDQQTLADGSVAATHNINLIGRDAQGRTHGEMRSRMPADFQGMTPLIEVHLFDPQTRIRSVCIEATHIASQQVMPEAPIPSASSRTERTNPLLKVEDLGSDVLEGITVRGTRRTLTIPAEANSTGAPLTVVDEYWYSDELHLNLRSRHTDPRTGVHEIKLTDLKRAEPEPAFFQVPEGYKIVDVTPTPGSPAGHAQAVIGPAAQ